MTPVLALAAVAAYFALMFVVSRAASRHGSGSFFTAGRRMPWPMVAFATLGASISGVTFISVPGMVADKGFGYLQMVLGFIVGYGVIAFLLVPLFYRRNLISIYGYLEQRFGIKAYRTGAWLFFISKMLGASVRFFVVCVVLQTIAFGPLGIPFGITVVITVGVVWLMTFRGGVSSVLWIDMLKSFCLIASVILCMIFIGRNMDAGIFSTVSSALAEGKVTMFYFDDPRVGQYFWKQFFAGVFMAIAMNGLDQDIMQRNLACRNSVECCKNMVVSGIMQFFVIAMFLLLGVVMYAYVDAVPSLASPEKPDELFCRVATHGSLPPVVGLLFVVGLVSAGYTAAASALVALTTSFAVDILGISDDNVEYGVKESTRRHTYIICSMRARVHAVMAVLMGAVIVAFFFMSDEEAISAVYTLASYTYGPILGLFAFGLFSHRYVMDRWIPVACVFAPAACYFIRGWLSDAWGYQMSFELLILNAVITMLLLLPFSRDRVAMADKANI